MALGICQEKNTKKARRGKPASVSRVKPQKIADWAIFLPCKLRRTEGPQQAR
jgi:hypothetical protein